MANEVQKQNRRELLAGLGGAFGVLAAETIMHAPSADAATGDPVLAGNSNTANAETGLTNTGTTGSGLAVQGPSYGLRGLATTNNGTGTYGASDHGVGVEGLAGALGGNGVFGHAFNPAFSAVYGEHENHGNGVRGFTDTTGDAAPAACHGENIGSGPAVRGVSAQGTGVYGQSGATASNGNTPSQHGVHGVSGATGYIGVFGEHLNGGTAVQGSSFTGSNSTGVLGLGARGVFGLPTSGGTGVVATNSFDGTGLALDCVGPAQFELSGLAKIGAGKQYINVTGVSLRATSLVLATMQNDIGVFVASAVPHVAGSKITIGLNNVVPAAHTAHVAWFVVN